jgi:CBS-domain-containing membrane protein
MARIPTIAELMSRELVCARRSDTFPTAYQTMVRAGIHQLPVVDEEQRFVGVLSSREVMEPPTRPRAHCPVERYVLRSEVTVLADTDALTATDLMLENGLDALPVVDRSWKLLGVITETDLLRALRWMVAPVTDGRSRSSA